jgi:hypothetical protein
LSPCRRASDLPGERTGRSSQFASPDIERESALFAQSARVIVVAETRNEANVENSKAMVNLRKLEQDILANGRVDGHELETLRRELYAGGKIDREKADFLVELHKRVQHMTPAFDHFFYQAIKDHILGHGRISAEETAWLRRMLFADGKIKDEERKFLHELKGEAKETSPEFEALFKESMKEPPEQHTSGHG